MLKNTSGELFKEPYLYYLPLLLIVAGAFREVVFRARAKQIARYLRTVEKLYKKHGPADTPVGWETNLKMVRKRFGNKALRNSVVVFWLLLVGTSLTLSEHLASRGSGSGYLLKMLKPGG